MSQPIDADFTSNLLFPPALEDWIPADHPARVVRSFVDSLDLKALGFRIPEGTNGRPAYAPALLLRLWLYGYLRALPSCRSLEHAAQNDLGAIWLAGRHRPDHNTLWRFWRDNRHALSPLFAQSVRQAEAQGHIGYVLHALDGTRIATAASEHAAVHRTAVTKILERIDLRVKELEAGVERAGLADLAAQSALASATPTPPATPPAHQGPGDDNDNPPSAATCDRPAPGTASELARLSEHRTRAQAKLALLDEKATDHLQPGDLDARRMKSRSRFFFGYNAQAVVDEASGLIVATGLTNLSNDIAQLAPMLEETRRLLGKNAADTVADAGYAQCEDQLARAEELGIALTVARRPSEQEPYAAAQFVFDRAADRLVCPEGREVARAGKRKDGVRRFRCERHRKCPVRAQCCQGKGGRTVDITATREVAERSRARAYSERGRELLRRRMAAAERCFARIKHIAGVRRFSVRGLVKTAAQWALVCLGHNLKQQWLSGRSMAMAAG